MITSLLTNDPTLILWVGILLVTIMMFSAAIVTVGVHLYSNKTRTIFLCIEVISALLFLDILFYVVTR